MGYCLGKIIDKKLFIMKSILIIFFGLLLLSCTKQDECGNQKLPDCIKQKIDVSSVQIFQTVKRQKVDGEYHYWLNTGAMAWDGVEYIVNCNCDTICSYCGECFPPECSKKYDFDKWETIWENENHLQFWNNIPERKYFENDIMPAKFADCYGYWIVTGTSGGLHGNGYPKDFDKLLMKKNGIFGIVRNDSLIDFGKMVLQTENNGELLCKFEFENQININLYHVNVAYIHLDGKDSLTLLAPCCDNYNIHLKREGF